MARLTGPPDKSLELRLLAYEFPHLNDKWDGNWLIVRIDVVDGGRQWSATAPVILTWELRRLVSWLRQLSDEDPDATSSWGCLEPNLSFESIGRGETTRLRALFDQEFHPEYTSWRGSGRLYDLDEAVVEFEPSVPGLRRFADELQAELERFPERSTDR